MTCTQSEQKKNVVGSQTNTRWALVVVLSTDCIRGLSTCHVTSERRRKMEEGKKEKRKEG